MLKKIAAHKLVLAAFFAGLVLAVAAYALNLPHKAAEMGLPVPGVAVAAVEVTPTPTPRPRIGPMYPLKERIVNLAGDKGKRYLKIGLTLQLQPPHEDEGKDSKGGHGHEEKAEDRMGALAPIIDDAVTSILTTKTYEDVITLEGKESLKSEIRDKVNELLGEEQVVQVYITDFVVQ